MGSCQDCSGRREGGFQEEGVPSWALYRKDFSIVLRSMLGCLFRCQSAGC